MTPKWKFRDVPRTEHSAPPFYEQPWPSDLPENCQVCGTKFRHGFNISNGAGRIGRILRTTAYAGFLPCILLPFILSGLFPDSFQQLMENTGFRGNPGFHLFFGMMFFPPMLLAGLSVIMPNSRHLECKKCGWNRDYKPLPLPNFDTTSGKS